MAFVKAATLTVEFDISIERTVRGRDFVESPYECRVSIVDDRGKEYLAVLKGWWYPEQPPKPVEPTGSGRSQKLLNRADS